MIEVNMNITSAQYVSESNKQTIVANIDGETMYVPVKVGNRHYDEIMRQVDAKTLTIADAE
tara:strand:- start:61 stop:243 length:183 start_codon:yes stop_codon:yes gene_type:complete